MRAVWLTSLVLAMGVDVVSDCVVFPHLCTWSPRPALSRTWRTDIVPGVTGSGDRSTGQNMSYQRLEYSLKLHSMQERARLNARLLAAMKSGRACAPFFPRGQRLAEIPVAQPWEWHPSIGNTAIVTGLIPGQTYWWEKGEWDLGLGVPGLYRLTESGSFVADGEIELITMSSAVQPGSVRVLCHSQRATEGLWQWQPGQYAFFIRRPSPNHDYTGENISLQIDAGAGGSSDPWLADIEFISGGASVATSSAIDRSLVSGYPVPPESIYQKARSVSDDSDVLSYAVWGEVAMTFCYSGLTIGERYIYKPGPYDVRMYCVGTGGATELTEAGVFTAGDTIALVEVNNLVAPGVIRPYHAIAVAIRGLVRGIESRVRLHFAEIEGFDGSAARHQFDVTVAGDHLERAPGVEPYARSGALNKAYCLDFLLCPDISGELHITLSPIAPDFFATVSAVEVFQFEWEVVELAAGTTANLLKWDGYLKGHYRGGSGVYPVIFGRPSVMNAPAFVKASPRLAIAEPPGISGIGTPGTCPAEECKSDPPLETNPLPAWPTAPVLGCGNFFRGSWYNQPEQTQALEIGHGGEGEGSPLGLTESALEAWAADMWAQFWAEMQRLGITPSQTQISWLYEPNPPGGFKRWHAEQVYSGNYFWAAYNYNWVLTIEYCV